MKLLVGITGASGSLYAESFLNFASVCQELEQVFVVLTKTGQQVCTYELIQQVESHARKSILVSLLKKEELPSKFQRLSVDDFFCQPASGSSSPDAALILPCSMGTLGRIAGGFSSNLLERSADVIVKEGKNLVICPRETPLSAIHLENMLKLSRLGVKIVPAMPGFYQRPKSLEDISAFIAGKCAEALGLKHSLYQPWKSP